MRFSGKPLVRAIAALGLACGLASSPIAQSPPSTPAEEARYVIGARDVLNITVWGPGGLSERFTVEGDGTFTFPMLGRVNAGGLTMRQLQDQLARQLSDGFFKDPHVTVVVENYQSQHILVVGEVRNPGKYTLTGPMTLLEALALAGSATPDAGGVAIVRRPPAGGRLAEAGAEGLDRPDGAAAEIRVDLEALQDGAIAQDVILQDGDTIVVPRSTPVHVFGFVSRPGEYAIGPRATVRDVLSLAGGVAPRGAVGRVTIVRDVDGREREISVKLDDLVKPGDTIVVPERYF